MKYMGPILAMLAILVLLLTWTCGAAAEEKAADNPKSADMGTLFSDLVAAWEANRRIDTDTDALKDELLTAIAQEWKRVYLNPDYRIYLNGKDDPGSLPVSGKHAFVVLGLMLEDGEMAEELKARCDAAAAAAQAWPDSIIVCSGGATGKNNPEGHTEAGLMRQYLETACGIAPERILTDERAMDTIDNAVNTFGILKAQGIDTITVVTSSYHQRRAHMLYFTLAEHIRETEGYSVAIAGNFGCEIDYSPAQTEFDVNLAAFQLNSMIQYLRGKDE